VLFRSAVVERAGAEGIARGLELFSVARDAAIEWTFHAVFGSAPMRRVGESRAQRVADAPMGDLRALSNVQEALDRMTEGGFAGALIRMLILLARARGTVRRTRLEAANRLLEHEPPFDTMSPKHRTRLVHRESLVVAFAPDEAIATLPRMLPTTAERARALQLCHEVSGPASEQEDTVREMFDRLVAVLQPQAGPETGVADARAGAAGEGSPASPRRRRTPDPAPTRTPLRSRTRPPAGRRRSSPRFR